MRHQITKVGLIAAIVLFAIVGGSLAMITPSISDAQAKKNCLLPNGNPYPGNDPNGCPPGLDKQRH